MKGMSLFFLLAFTQTADAQDYCKRIKTEISDDKTMYDYSSPYDPLKVPAVRVNRKYSTDSDIGFDNFSVIFQIPATLDDIYTKSADGGQVEKEEKKLVIEFDDKSKLTDEDIPVSHDITDDRMQAIRQLYYPLTDANVKELSSKKIVKFSLAGIEQNVPADSATAIQHYVQCMKAMK
jgi:hypothetical protein